MDLSKLAKVSMRVQACNKRLPTFLFKSSTEVKKSLLIKKFIPVTYFISDQYHLAA